METGGALKARPSIGNIDVYTPGRSSLPGVAPVVKLSSNETPLGPSPAAREAYVRAAAALDRYPDGSARALRNAIGETYGLDPARIVCGNGSDELFHYLAQAYLDPGDEAIYTEHGFTVYRIVILAIGATPVVAPETDLTADVDAILARVTPRTRMVFIANPNNPTGTYIPGSEVRRLRAGLPDRVLLVLDGAYAEYVREADYDAGAALVAETSNTVMTRTFSKIHGLASARVGWAYCPAGVAETLNRIRSPFNVSGPGMAAAIASLGDRAHLDAAAEHNARWREWLAAEIARSGLSVVPSVANFLLVRFPDAPGLTSSEADAFLAERRIIVRRASGYGLPDCLRITIGLEAENRAVAAALAEFVQTRHG
ncbi:MAG: histidinol-phosphate transaminase [Hyphomicrobiales bacterium]|nr:histidinol-phosphate transaminase [Hyphomicrobiales bacterium]